MSDKNDRLLTDEDRSAMYEPLDAETEAWLRETVPEEQRPGVRWLMRKAEHIIYENRRKRAH